MQSKIDAIPMGRVLVSITLSFLPGLFIVFIYRNTYAGVDFSSSFAGFSVEDKLMELSGFTLKNKSMTRE